MTLMIILPGPSSFPSLRGPQNILYILQSSNSKKRHTSHLTEADSSFYKTLNQSQYLDQNADILTETSFCKITIKLSSTNGKILLNTGSGRPRKFKEDCKKRVHSSQNSHGSNWQQETPTNRVSE